MGTSYSAAVVFGVPWKFVMGTKTVTRYNETTGKPYEKAISSTIKRVFYGKNEHDEDVEYDIPQLEDDVQDSLADYFSGMEYGVFGIELCSMDLQYNCKPVELGGLIAEHFNTLNELFAKHYPELYMKTLPMRNIYMVDTSS